MGYAVLIIIAIIAVIAFIKYWFITVPLLIIIVFLYPLLRKNNAKNTQTNTSGLSQNASIKIIPSPRNYNSVPHINPPPDFIQNILDMSDRLYPIQIKEFTTKINECDGLIKATKNPRVFFERYDYAFAMLSKLIPYEKKYSIELVYVDTPSSLMEYYINYRDNLINNHIINAINPIRNNSETSDTQKEKAISKYKGAILEYGYLLSDIHKQRLDSYEYTCQVETIKRSNQTANISVEKKSKIVSLFTNKWLDIVSKEFVVIDIETTGLSKASDFIIEIAAIRYVNCRESEKFVTLVNPKVTIPPTATAINNITNPMVKNSPQINTVMPDLLAFLRDSVIVGHNINFDIGFIEINARRLGHDPSWNYIDTISVAKKMIPDLPNYKQDTVLNAIKYNQARYHRAEDDCRGCAEIVLLGINNLVSINQSQ